MLPINVFLMFLPKLVFSSQSAFFAHTFSFKFSVVGPI